jgi:WD40 repeat protein/serine/threonine protein kinase
VKTNINNSPSNCLKSNESPTVVDRRDKSETLPFQQDIPVKNVKNSSPQDDLHFENSNNPVQKGATLLEYTVDSSPFDGGMGRVYRVVHNGWNVYLAMKQPNAAALAGEDRERRFVNECEAWINLGLHPNIVSCYYVRRINGTLSVFAEWMDGGSLLRGWIYRADECGRVIADECGNPQRGKLYDTDFNETAKRITDIALQCVRGLRYASERGVIHRDVKPDNILMSIDGRAKIADFGIAAASGTLDGNRACTPDYCSPEQAYPTGGKPDLRSDIWSWAVTVLEMFVGRRPWAQPENFPEPGGVTAGKNCEEYFQMAYICISDEMKALLRRCFRMNIDERPRSFAEVESELLQIYVNLNHEEYPRPTPDAAPDTADSLNNKALSFLDLEMPDETVRLWQSALAASPSHPESRYNHCVFLWNSAKADDARVIRLMNEYRSELTDLYLSKIHLARYDAERAAESLRKAEIRFGTTREIKKMQETLASMSREGNAVELRKTMNICSPGTGRISRFSNSLKTVVSADVNGEIRIADTDTGQVRNIDSHEGHIATVNGLSLTPDGLAAISCADDTVKLWDLHECKCIRSCKWHAGETLAVAFGPDGETVLSGGRDGTMQCRNIRTDECSGTFRGHAGAVYSLCFLSDGSGAFAGDESEIRLWNFASGACVRTFEGHEAAVVALRLSPDGKTLLSGSADTSVKLWDVDTGKCLRTLARHEDTVNTVAFAPDGKTALSGANDGTVKLTDVASGKCHHTFSTGALPVVSAEFAANGKSIMTDSCGTAELWNIPAKFGKPEMIPSGISDTETALRNRRRFDRTVSLIREKIRTGEMSTAISGLKICSEIPLLGTGTEYRKLKKEVAGYCKLYSPCSYSDVRTIDCKANTVSLAPDGAGMLSAGNDNSMKLWDTQTKQCIREFKGHSSRINSVCFAPDGKTALSGSDDGDARLWNVASGDCLHVFAGDGKAILAVCFSPDGKTVLSADSDGKLNFNDTETKQSLHVFRTNFGRIESLACSPDGTVAIISNGNRTKLIDTKTGTFLVCRANGYTTGFSRNGKKVASIAGNSIQITDFRSGQIEGVFAGFDSACFSPNGKWIAATSVTERTLKLLDTASGQNILSFNYRQTPRSVSFSNDSFVMTVLTGGSAAIYELDYQLRFASDLKHDEAFVYAGNFLTLYPKWTNREFSEILIPELRNAGLGGVAPDTVLKWLNAAERPEPMNETMARETRSTGWSNKIKRQLILVSAVAVLIVLVALTITSGVPYPEEGILYVYKNGSSAMNHFHQRNWMGDNYDNIPEMNETSDGMDGSTGIEARIDFRNHEWGGYIFAEGLIDDSTKKSIPNYGDFKVGFNLTEAKRLTFHARGRKGGEVVEFFTAGLGHGSSLKYPDSSSKISLGFVKLSYEWKKYEINLSGHDLSRIAGGFAWMSSAEKNPGKQTLSFLMDEIRFEY